MQTVFTQELALESALASTKMEGFQITEQTRYDCERLLDKEVSVEELVKEIIDRTAKKVK